MCMCSDVGPDTEYPQGLRRFSQSLKANAGIIPRIGHDDFHPFQFMSSIILQLDAVDVGVVINLWLFLFAAQPKKFFLDGLKKLEQRSHKCVKHKGEYVE
jgi:hypothetical protein